jgi:hypothetical protein
VDRQHPPALGVDVGKGAVRQACTLPRAKWWHLLIMVRWLGRRHSLLQTTTSAWRLPLVGTLDDLVSTAE